MRNRFREEVYDHPPITITCPYCGEVTHMCQPNLEDSDLLMDQNCDHCKERIFAQFKFVPELTAVYKLELSTAWMDRLSKEFPNAS